MKSRLNATIRSTGSYLPETFVHNEELTQFPASATYMISQKTGVFSRRRAAEDECTSDLAAKAALRCLSKKNVPAEAVDALIVSTSSPDRMQPATATRVQHLIGAHNAFAFDINSVCSGSTYGITVSDALIKAGQCRRVLFVAAEVYSRILNEKDFSTYPYFGDGAGAILFTVGESDGGVLHSLLKTDGGKCDTIRVPGGGTMLPYDKVSDRGDLFFKMKGKEVFEFAIGKGSQIVTQLLEAAGILPRAVKCFICHQANVNIITAIAARLRLPEELFYLNLYRYGNMASASVPVALDEALTRGILEKGDLVVTVAFGGGLSWGANLIRV
jgi:3-oxoacyl-[acyl-carrier-protein] synthase-3